MENTTLRVGEMAPEFSLRGVVTKPEVKRVDVKLSDWRDRQNVILVFHPFAFTATWDKQIPSLQAILPELEGLNSQVLAVSCDAIASKQAWGVSLGGISYPLVADFWPHGEMSAAYGVFNKEFGRPDRATIIIDKSGIVRWLKMYEPGILPNNAELLTALRESV